MRPTVESLSMQRTYGAPPQRVFDAWTRVDLLKQWFGCANDRLWTIHRWDARVGGALHVSLDFDGKPFEVRGQFLVVDPPRRLAYRWRDHETIDVAFEPDGTGTRVRLTHMFPEDPEARAILATGWSSSLAELDRIPASERP